MKRDWGVATPSFNDAPDIAHTSDFLRRRVVGCNFGDQPGVDRLPTNTVYLPDPRNRAEKISESGFIELQRKQ